MDIRVNLFYLATTTCVGISTSDGAGGGMLLDDCAKGGGGLD